MFDENINAETPRNLDMECELLGMLLLKNGSCISKVASILTPDDFSANAYQIIFSTILNQRKRGLIPNIATLIEELRGKVDLEILLSIGNSAFTTAYAEQYTNIIKEKSNLRKLIHLAKKIYSDSIKPNADFNSIALNSEIALRNLTLNAEPSPLISKQNYFSHSLTKEISAIQKYSNRLTGFYNIDLHQIFSPGLYVIGATPAAGKTTFCWQLLEQLSSNDEFCIFCSYEMSALELYTKSLARELFLSNPHTILTAADIRKGAHSEDLDSLIISLSTDKNLKGAHLLQLRDESIDDLLRLLKPLCTGRDKSPIVCVDYLQIIPPSSDQRLTTDKAKIDDIVHKLKSFQRETNTTFIVVSSFNRMNYYQQVSFESFKESGNIEYSADVVWALQLNVVNDIKIGAAISDTRQKFDEAKKQQPRELQLKCLKNRQGNNYDAFFFYFSAHDFFQPCQFEDFIKPPLSYQNAEQEENEQNVQYELPSNHIH